MQCGGEAYEMDIDSEFMGNESRFLNDYRGIASRPNVNLEGYYSKYTGEWKVENLINE